jgi:uncharacterized protein DUF6456
MSGARPKRARDHARAAGRQEESPLAWLRKRRDRDGEPMISQMQFDAGERLRTDFWFAQMTPRVTMNWSPSAPAQRRRKAGMAPAMGADIEEGAAAARERVRRALANVGPELAGVLIDVCCHLKGLEAAERAAGWPQRSGKVVLQLALTRLARHYGLGPAPERGARRAANVRHWGSNDYRPSFELPAE